MRRRRLLTAVAAGMGALAGCPAGGGSIVNRPGNGQTATATASSTPTLSGPPVPTQAITLSNTQPDASFVTLVVERGRRTVLTESRELVAGERHVVRDVLDVGGTYDVVVETAEGARGTYAWSVEPSVEGLEVTLGRGLDFARTVTCGPDCALALEGEGTVPLVGDGTGQWYAPAQVVLANPSHGTSRRARLTASLDGETVLDYRYRVPPETRLTVPTTYRSGRYTVVVETGGERLESEWRVPEEPSRVVDLSTGAVGCGPANTELHLENHDDTTHQLTVVVSRGGRTVFSERYGMAPGSRRSVVPVGESGRYEVRTRIDAGPEQVAQWWACSPHGPATILIDATGTTTLRQAGLRVPGESQPQE